MALAIGGGLVPLPVPALPAQQQPARLGGLGRGGLHPHSGHRHPLGWQSLSMPQGLIPTHQRHPAGTASKPSARGGVTARGSHILRVPHPGGPSLLHRDEAVTAALGVQPPLLLCPQHRPAGMWHWEPQFEVPTGAGGRPVGSPHPSSSFLTPKRDRQSFSLIGPKSRGAGMALAPFPGTRWAQGWADPGPSRSSGSGGGSWTLTAEGSALRASPGAIPAQEAPAPSCPPHAPGRARAPQL